MDEAAADDSGTVARALTALAPALVPGGTAIEGLARLTGGASLQTWAFDAVGPDARRALILRRRGPGEGAVFETSLPLATEARLLRAAQAAGVPVAGLVHAGDGLGEGYVVERVAGETLGRRIAAGEAFGPARAKLADQCGRALARIHAIDDAPALPVLDAAATIARYEDIYRRSTRPRPILEAALRTMAATMPAPVAPRLLHGDFRNGNLIVDPQDGLRAVLDWELAHRGDPAEDLGWLCVNSWRFGVVEREAGGFATLDALLDAYAAAGGDPPPAARVRFWQMVGSFKWAVITMMMYRSYATGETRSVERALIGRRLSECEADLVALMQAAA